MEPNNIFGMHKVNVSAHLSREELLELGRNAPYHRFDRFINYPVKITEEIKLLLEMQDFDRF